MGPEFPVNTFSNGTQRTFFQTPQAVATDSFGDFVATWTSYGQDGSGNGVFAQLYDSRGAAVTSEFRANTFTPGNQLFSTVAMDPSGDFVITWTSYGEDGSGAGVFAQRYNALGISQGREFQVNTTTAGDQKFSTVAMDSAGDFVVTWTSYDGSGYGIFAQRYSAAGFPLGGEFGVNVNTVNTQQFSHVAADANGDFVVTWESYGADNSGFGIVARRFNSSGAAVTGDFLVNTNAIGNQRLPTVAMDPKGDFVFTWSGYNGTVIGSGYDVYARRYSAAGAAQGPEFQVNQTNFNNQLFSSVGIDPLGDFVIVWSSAGQDPDGSYGVYGRTFNISGTALNDEFPVNTFASNTQAFPSVAMDSLGDFVAVWSSYGQAGTGYGVFGQRFSAANLAPIIQVPVAQTTPLNTTLVFSGTFGNQIQIADPDAGTNTVSMTLTASNGTLSLFNRTGLTFTVGDGLNDATMTFVGTIANINNALNGLSFVPTTGFTGTAALQLSVDDLGNLGTGGAKVTTKSVAITVGSTSGVNQAPVNIVPGAQTTPPNTPLVFSASNGNLIATSDADAGTNPVRVTLSATNGVITLSSKTGLSFSVGDGVADAAMTFTGTIANINTALNGLVFSPTTNFQGSASLTIATNDLGNTGTGGAKADIDTVPISVAVVTTANQAPVNLVPGAQTAFVNTPLVFSVSNGNVIATSDPDAGTNPIRVTLTASQGTVTLSTKTGLTFFVGDGTADAVMTFQGTLTAINNALNGMIFTPTANFQGTAALTILTNDLGNTGTGGAMTDSDTVAISVIPTVNVNAAPVNIVPGPQGTVVGVPVVFSSSIGNQIGTSDSDAGLNPVQVTLTATAGVMTLATTSGLTFLTGDGTADGVMAFTGSIPVINNALDGLVFTPTPGFEGTASIKIATNDLGNTGSGGPKTDTDTVSITVSPVTSVNQAPVNIVPGPQTATLNTPFVFSAANGNRIGTSDVDAGASAVRVTLTATSGVVTLSTKTGLTFSTGDGTADAVMTFQGTLSDLNNALNGLIFTPTANFQGSAALTITTNDLGHTGSGGAKSDTDTVPITVASAGTTTVTYNSFTNTLSITATASEAIVVRASGGNISVLINGVANTSFGTVAANRVQAIVVTGGAGGNRIDLSGVTTAAFPGVTSVTINGAGGNDTILGSDFNDTILGGDGNDLITGRGGNDNLNGQAGNDSLVGANGNDTLRGGNGVDILVGDAGNDNLDGQGSTGDRLQGGSGTNILNLQSGTDIQDETTVFNFPF
jgi:hypothetical protein